MRKKVFDFCIDLSPVFLLATLFASLIACKAERETDGSTTVAQQPTLQMQQAWDDYQRTYRCVQASLIEQRHNEMFLAGQHLPALVIDKCKNQPTRIIDVSSTTRIMDARIDQLKSIELTPRQQAERITSDILRIEATGVRDLEYVDCFTGIACFFTGPLAGFNNLDHLTYLIERHAEESAKMNNDRGAPDSDPEKGPRPLSVGAP